MSENKFPQFLRIAAIHSNAFKAFSLSLENGSIVQVLDAALIRNIADALGFSFDIHLCLWPEVESKLKRSEVDMVIGEYRITEERLRTISYSFPYNQDVLTFVTDKPQPLPVGVTLFEPFSSCVWAALITSLILVSFFINKDQKSRVSYTGMLYSLFGTLLGQPLNFKIHSSSTRFLVLAWIFCAFIIANGYRAIISAVLAFPIMAGIKDFSDFSKAASQRSVQCYTYFGSSYSETLASTKDESLLKIAECLKLTENSHLSIYKFPSVSGKKAFLSPKMYIMAFEESLFISEDFILPSFNAIGIPKNFCCLERLNIIIHRITEAGLFEKYLQDVKFWGMLYLRNTDTIFMSEDSETVQKIVLKDIGAAFLLLSVNYFLAVVILFFEIVSKKKKENPVLNLCYLNLSPHQMA